MKFSTLALRVMVASLIAHLLQALTGYPVWGLAVVNLACLIFLWRIAGRAHRQRREGFDVIVAAETIVAFGIMSLILGLTVALLPIVMGTKGVDITSASALGRLALPFLVGLGTAGVAPFFAMLLRNQSVEEDALVDPVGDTTDLAKAMGALKKQLLDVEGALRNLQETAATAGGATHNFADMVETETGRLKLILLESQAQLRSFGSAADDGGTQVQKLANETTRLSGASSDAAKLLEALGALIVAVERFVAPGVAGDRRR